MPFSICGPDRRRSSRHGRWAGLGLAALTIVVSASASGAVQQRPWVRFGAGAESDLVVDPSAPQVVVPGGSFVIVAPGVGAWVDDSTGWRWGATTQLQAQFFLESPQRTLLSPALWAEAEHSLGRWSAIRFAGGAQAFDDSERRTVRRLGANSEVALGLRGRDWRLEAIGGADVRHYPRLEIVDDGGRVTKYRETGLSAGAYLRWRPAAAFRFDARASHLWTDARDAAYDADAWSARAGFVWWPTPRWEVEGDFAWQERSPEDPLRGEDSYDRFGAGVHWAFARDLKVGVRVAHARYRWPDGQDTDTQRVELSLTRQFGRTEARPAEPVAAPRTLPPVGDDGNVRFEVHAPSARSVEVIGSFTQWRQGHALTPASEGWWKLDLSLPPGVHEYTYVVDGRVVAPPEATITVDDGFGGKNGLIEVPGL